MPKKESDKKNQRQYLCSFTLAYDVVLKSLTNSLYEKEIIEGNSKWAITKFSILRTLYDYADEVIKGFNYTPEQLINLINMHEQLKKKFEKKLIELSESLEEQYDEVIQTIEE